MAETDQADESMEGGEGGEEYVAETETSQTEGGEEGENEENNTTYNTDAVEEEAPTQVDTTYADIFGADEEEEEQAQQEAEDTLGDDIEYEREHYEKPQQVIGSPLRLVTNPLPTPPEDSLVVRVKLPNIIGIQSKPFTHQSLEEELTSMYEDDEEEGKKRHGIAESQIRWRYVEGTRDVKESNARIVKWSDGSMHLMLGNEMLEMTMHDLNAEQLYLYAKQPGFLHSQGRLNKKVVIRPASLDNKLHQKLSMSLAERNQRISKVKLVTTTMDPEIEKAQKEKLEEEKIKKIHVETEKKNRIMRQFGFDAAYLEQTGEYDEPPPPSTFRRDREIPRYQRDNSRNLQDFIVDDESDDDEEEERERRTKKKKRPEYEEDTERLMNAKRDLSPEPKKRKEKEKEKRKVRKGGNEEAEEEVKEEEKTETTEESADAPGVEENGGGMDEEEEEVSIVKKPTKARRGVIVDDDEAET